VVRPRAAPTIIDSSWKPGIGEAFVVDVTRVLDDMASLLVEVWMDVEAKVLGIYGCGPTKFAGSKSVGNGF